MSALTPTVELGAQWPPMGIERAPREVASVLLCSHTIYVYLAFIDTYHGYSRIENLIRFLSREAEYKSSGWFGLPRKDNRISGNWHADDKKLGTYFHHQPRGNILSRILRCYTNIAAQYGSRLSSCQKVSWFSHTGDLKRNVQAAKSVQALNVTSRQPRDLTAYEYNLYLMRRRSLHSSRIILRDNNIKGDSQTSLTENAVDNNNIVSSKSDKPLWVSGRDDVTTTVTKLLVQRSNIAGKHYKLLDILADPFYLEKCYNEIMSKPGNMTKGLSKETLDGISWEWFEKTAIDLKSGKFKFSPNRRIEIPKANGKLRPLGIGTPREKIVQKGIHGILEAIFEPKFLATSNGFRRKKSVHTALVDIYLKGSKYNWVIQGDISKCFDNIPHSIIMKLIQREIGDPRLLELIKKFISAGYVGNDGILHQPKEGTPQGGVLSPLLANIVLHQLDMFMDDEKIRFDKGIRRRKNPQYSSLQAKRARATENAERTKILNEMRSLRRSDQFDPNFRRLTYIRYADDFVVLLVGDLKNAEFIKNKIKEILKSKCGLDLNNEKTTINSMTDKWNFLGAEIRNLKVNNSFLIKQGQTRRAIGIARTLVSAPIEVILKKLKAAKFIRQNHMGKYLPRGYTPMMNLSHHEIITFYNGKIRGLINFYKFAANRASLYSISWLLKASCALTLAKKYKLRTMSKVFKAYGPDLTCPVTNTGYFKIADLKVLHDYGKKEDKDIDKIINQTWAGKDTKSSFNESCTICGTQQFIEMHHIRSVKDIRAKYRRGEKITRAQFDGAIMRKQVPLCSYHHILFHKGELNWLDMKRVHSYNKHRK